MKKVHEDASSWIAGASGKAVKMVYALLYSLPAAHTYKVILMNRNLDEVSTLHRTRCFTDRARTPKACPGRNSRGIPRPYREVEIVAARQGEFRGGRCEL